MVKPQQQHLTHHILKQELNVGLAGNIGDSFAKQVALKRIMKTMCLKSVVFN
jgi:hypothetical protein